MNNKDITNAQTEANIKQSIGDYDFKSLANQYASTPMTRDIREDVPSTPPTERQTLMGVRDKTPENHMKAYITPEEGELLRRAGGSGVMTPEGIPMYENDLTADQMQDKLNNKPYNIIMNDLSYVDRFSEQEGIPGDVLQKHSDWENTNYWYNPKYDDLTKKEIKEMIKDRYHKSPIGDYIYNVGEEKLQSFVDEIKPEKDYKSIMSKVYEEAQEKLSDKTRDRLLQEAMEQNRKLEASEDFAGSMTNEAASDRVNLMYDALLEDELTKYDPPAFVQEAADKIKRIPKKLKSLMSD